MSGGVQVEVGEEFIILQNIAYFLLDGVAPQAFLDEVFQHFFGLVFDGGGRRAHQSQREGDLFGQAGV